MASGDTLLIFTALSNSPPAIAGASFLTRAGLPVIVFDAADVQEAIFLTAMPRNYDGGGITSTGVWSGETATTGDVIWEAAFRSIKDDVDDVDTKPYAAFNSSGAVTAPSVSGEVSYDAITFTDGADMDSVAAGEMFNFKFRRNAADVADTMAGNAQMWTIELRET